MPASLLLRVATTWPLPNLGLLALPAAPPHLTAYPLHTALAVATTDPSGFCQAAIDTVEEVTYPDAPNSPVRGLLLSFETATATLLPGTEIRLA